MNVNELLPIGSIVLLEGAEKKTYDFRCRSDTTRREQGF